MAVSDAPPPDTEPLPLDIDHPTPPTPDAVVGAGTDRTSGPRSFAPATVVARAQDGDTDAFTQLVREYEAALFRLAYRMLGDRGDAQDVVQDAMLLAWRKLPTLADPQAFPAWIFHLTTRQCLNIIRSRRRHPADLDPTGTAEDPTPGARGHTETDSTAAAAESAAQRRSLDQVLASLPAEQRACWVLKELHGLSYPEISYAVGVPVSTVRGRIVRARQQLAKGMTAWQ